MWKSFVNIYVACYIKCIEVLLALERDTTDLKVYIEVTEYSFQIQFTEITKLFEWAIIHCINKSQYLVRPLIYRFKTIVHTVSDAFTMSGKYMFVVNVS